MKKSIYIILFLVLSYAFDVYADISELNGNNWLQWGEQSKNYFMVGFISGSNNVVGSNNHKLKNIHNMDEEKVDLKMKEALFKNANKVCLDTPDILKYRFSRDVESSNKKSDEINRFSILNFTVQNINEGLNELYSDFKNRTIKLPDAVYYVIKQINGESPAELEKILYYLRSGDIEKLNRNSKLSLFPDYIKFP